LVTLASRAKGRTVAMTGVTVLVLLAKTFMRFTLAK
jgi:hypothetical protein